MATDNPSNAIDEFREAARIDPNFLDPHNSLALALAKKGDWSGVAAECRETVRLRPDSAADHGCLAVALFYLGEGDKALPESREAVRLNPKDVVAHLVLGYTLLGTRQWDASIAELENVIRLINRAKPQDALARTLLVRSHEGIGLALYGKQKWKQSFGELRLATRLAPEDLDSRALLAALLNQRGESSAASDEYRVVAQLTPRSTIVIGNHSGVHAVAKLIGPSEKMVELPKGQSTTVQVAAGEYTILARYGENPRRYVFSKGGPFTVKQTETHRSDVKIVLRGPVRDDLAAHQEFNKATPN
jgi:Flp pilus assembly protein TadD